MSPAAARYSSSPRGAPAVRHRPLALFAREPIKVLCVIGTRPEAIKFAPVIRALQRSPLPVSVLASAQHGDVLDDTFKDRRIVVHRRLRFAPGLNLVQSHASLLTEIAENIRLEQPELVLVQGDTTTALAGAQAAFYEGVAVGHVEAGLRTTQPRDPFPEEMNRRLITQIATLHFAPTVHAVKNLTHERVTRRVYLTGNTIVDELKGLTHAACPYFPGQVVLVTCHRRENQEQRLRALCDAVRRLDKRVRGPLSIIWPLHPNPSISGLVQAELGHEKRILLRPPLAYSEFLPLLCRADLVITDSGGVIEEATTLNRSLIIVRDETERPEALTVGHRRAHLITLHRMLRLPDLAAGMLLAPPRPVVPFSSIFGDGTAGVKIAEAIMQWAETRG